MKPLLVSLLLLAACASQGEAQTSGRLPVGNRHNIVVFLADDLGWRDVGAYGNKGIRTPNIDSLARSGMRVALAFGTSPQCSPSCISMLTGKFPHATGTEDLHTPLPAGERILPSYLRARGYFTGMMAKTHIGPNGERQFEWYSPRTADALPARIRCPITVCCFMMPNSISSRAPGLSRM